MKREEFLQKYAPAAIAEQKRSGIPASIILAQLIQESGWTLSKLADEAFNLFGIKASKGWDGAVYHATTGEYDSAGNYYQTLASFRKYNSYEESFADHTDFLRDNKRYAAIFSLSDPKEIAHELERAGYATDPNYAESLINLIEDNDLTRFDDPNVQPMPSQPTNGGATQAGWLSDKFNDAKDKILPDLGFLKNLSSPEWWKKIAGGGIVVLIIAILIILVAVLSYKSIVGVSEK